MTAHALAKALLEKEDLPVIINGWGSDEGTAYEVTCVDDPFAERFKGQEDDERTPRDKLGWPKPRTAISLNYYRS